MRVRCSDDDDDSDIMSLSDVLDLQDTDTDLQPPPKEKDMATKKQAAPAAEPETKAKKKTKAAAAPQAAPAAEKKSGGPRAVPEGHTGLNELASELGTTPAAMRRKLRGMEGFNKPEGQHGWYFKNGSKELAAIRKAFAPEPEAKK